MMIPTLLLMGFVVGLLTFRARILAFALVAFSLAWAALIAAGSSLGDSPAAFAVGAANAAIGIGVGAAVRLLIYGLPRARQTT